jgi:hypothetical protein
MENGTPLKIYFRVILFQIQPGLEKIVEKTPLT